jgi:hypothetical protein
VGGWAQCTQMVVDKLKLSIINQASVAQWRSMKLASTSVSVNSVPPACYADSTGHVLLRGHLNVNPVPAQGGALLAVREILCAKTHWSYL